MTAPAEEPSGPADYALSCVAACVTGEPAPRPPADLSCAPPAGCFVTLKKRGDLRGCIGTIEPVRHSLAAEIIDNAISAATRDPRFLPVEPEELAELEVSVDVLFPPEEVDDMTCLDPKRFGVIVENGSRRGLLLPDLDGVDTVEQQVEIARHKAFIHQSEPIKLYRFEVVRHE